MKNLSYLLWCVVADALGGNQIVARGIREVFVARNLRNRQLRRDVLRS